MGTRRFVDWSFNHYLEIAHPRFVAGGGSPERQVPSAHAAA
jgi:hypothetical protein